MGVSMFVHDGYTLHGHVEERKGLHSQVDFEYRPAAPSVGARLASGRTWDEHLAVSAQVLKEQIIRVHCRGDDKVENSSVPNAPQVRTPNWRVLDADDFLKLHDDIFWAMLGYVRGNLGPDLEESEKNSSGASGSNAPTP